MILDDMEPGEMRAYCKKCGKEYWKGTIRNHKDLLNMVKTRGGHYCMECIKEVG